MLNRRTVLATAALASVPLAMAQGRKDAVVLAMTLEPPGLDPTAGAASAIAEITQYLRGLWKDMPIFVNDVSALSWA